MVGKFIVFEGIDGSGKTTQSKLAVEYLNQKGYDAIWTKEPTNGKIGKLLKKEYLKISVNFPEIDAFLFCADRIEHIEMFIKPNLNLGKLVVSDRYNLSTFAYQQAQGISLSWLLELQKNVLVPDLVIFIDLSTEESIKRTSDSATIKFEKEEFLKKVRENFLNLPKILKNQKIIVVDGKGAIEEVRARIVRVLEDEILKS